MLVKNGLCGKSKYLPKLQDSNSTGHDLNLYRPRVGRSLDPPTADTSAYATQWNLPSESSRPSY